MATIEAVAERVAVLLTAGGMALSDPAGGDLVFEPAVALRPLARGSPPPDTWAVDGGQAVVADARCLQVVVVRAARARFVAGTTVREEQGELTAAVCGGEEARGAVEALGLGVAPDASLEGVAHLLRDGHEWLALERCVEEVDAGGLVLADGDLVPDWRIPSHRVAATFARARERGVVLAGVTKHSSLARGGAPLLAQLEREAGTLLGPRAMWWAPVARSRPDLDPPDGLRVVAARLDPDAPYSFRVDLVSWADPEETLGAISALADDAAFPGYPYPLSVADRLAACPGWLREEVRLALDAHLDRAGVPASLRDLAFADRHLLMERA